MYEFIEDKGLCCNEEIIADFCPQVIGIDIIYNLDSGEEKRCYLIEVIMKGGHRTEIQKVENLEKISFFNLWRIPDCDISKASMNKLIHKMQMDVFKIFNEKNPNADGSKEYKKTVIGTQGLYKYEGSQIYFFGNHIISSKQVDWDIKSRTEHSLKCGNASEDNGTVVKKFLNLMPGVSEILFYGSLFGVVKPIVIQCGLKPEFILALVGPSGHLKTSMVRLYSLWLKDEDAQEVSFRDHRKITTILSMADSISGQNFLMDDIHDAITGNVANKQAERLNEIARHTGKSSKCANIIVTAENLKGKGIFSCVDRMLQVNISRMSSEQLRELKQNINLLKSEEMVKLVCEFLENLMKHYDKVCEDIIEFWNQDCTDNDVCYDTRTYQHNKFIMLTEMLFRKYVLYNFPNASGKEQLMLALETNYKKQQQDLRMKRTEESERDIVTDVYRMFISKDEFVKKETSRIKYEPSDAVYLFNEGKWYITGGALKIAMSKYYKQNISLKKVVDALHEADVLDEDVDARSKKIKNKRHYVINIHMMEEYIKWCEEDNW